MTVDREQSRMRPLDEQVRRLLDFARSRLLDRQRPFDRGVVVALQTEQKFHVLSHDQLLAERLEVTVSVLAADLALGHSVLGDRVEMHAVEASGTRRLERDGNVVVTWLEFHAHELYASRQIARIEVERKLRSRLIGRRGSGRVLDKRGRNRIAREHAEMVVENADAVLDGEDVLSAVRMELGGAADDAVNFLGRKNPLAVELAVEDQVRVVLVGAASIDDGDVVTSRQFEGKKVSPLFGKPSRGIFPQLE